MIQLVHLPAFIKFSDDDELTYIASFKQWRDDVDLHVFDYDDSDMLIDSTGLIHSLNEKRNNVIFPASTDEIIDLDLAINFVKGHYSAMGSCCASKIGARSITQLFYLLPGD